MEQLNPQLEFVLTCTILEYFEYNLEPTQCEVC